MKSVGTVRGKLSNHCSIDGGFKEIRKGGTTTLSSGITWELLICVLGVCTKSEMGGNMLQTVFHPPQSPTGTWDTFCFHAQDPQSSIFWTFSGGNSRLLGRGVHEGTFE